MLQPNADLGPAVGKTPLDDWSAHRRELCCTTHNIYDTTNLLQPATPGSERPQFHTLNRAVTGTTKWINITKKYICVDGYLFFYVIILIMFIYIYVILGYQSIIWHSMFQKFVYQKRFGSWWLKNMSWEINHIRKKCYWPRKSCKISYTSHCSRYFGQKPCKKEVSP